MDLSPSAVVGRFRGKAARYIGLSMFGTVITQLQIFVYVKLWDWNGGVANFVAVTVSSVPSYFLSKHWVWQHHGKGSVAKEAVPYWILNLAGLVLSTVFAVVASHYFDQWWVVSLANLAGFGVLWVAKFLILDEYLFKSNPPPLVEF